MTFHVVVTESAKANLRHYHERAYRALFIVVGSEVQVLHIRPAAMGVATPDELFE